MTILVVIAVTLILTLIIDDEPDPFPDGDRPVTGKMAD